MMMIGLVLAALLPDDGVALQLSHFPLGPADLGRGFTECVVADVSLEIGRAHV